MVLSVQTLTRVLAMSNQCLIKGVGYETFYYSPAITQFISTGCGHREIFLRTKLHAVLPASGTKKDHFFFGLCFWIFLKTEPAVKTFSLQSFISRYFLHQEASSQTFLLVVYKYLLVTRESILSLTPTLRQMGKFKRVTTISQSGIAYLSR